MTETIDLGADIGESSGETRVGNDEELVPYLSSASIACGFHGGDPSIMGRSVRLCLRHAVAIGAHPSFADREGFGRRHIDMSSEDIQRLVLYQVGALDAIVRAEGGRMRHVKPHGALYNVAAADRAVADAIAAAVRDFDPQLALVGLAGSQLIAAAEAAGLRTIAEGFADRRYLATGMLAPREVTGATIDEPRHCVGQVLDMLLRRRVQSIEGTRVKVEVQSVCLHGDGENALRFARALVEAFAENGIELRRSD